MPNSLRNIIQTTKNKTRKIRKGLSGGGFFDFFSGPGNAAKQAANGKKLMSYPTASISYNNSPIFCDICKKDIFYVINASVERSKTATLIVGEEFQDAVSHPVKMYTCIECNNCKFVYQSTMWNGLTNKIIETKK